MIDKSIFREYDIRGLVPSQLNEKIIKQIAHAIAKKCYEEGVNEISLGRDGRLSGETLLNTLSNELQKVGLNVINVGLVTSPLLYFAAKKTASKSGIMITGSHNPKNYNGLKIVINDAPVSGKEILGHISSDVPEARIRGQEYIKNNLIEGYIDAVLSQNPTNIKKLKIVLDCGNGVAGIIAPRLFKSLGHEVIELFCDVDGSFPNHHPDPSKIENLQDLIQKVKETKADLGIAFDGDGDRLGVITNKGKIIFPDQLLMLFAEDVLKSRPNEKIIFDVKCSKFLEEKILENQGIPIMSPTGHFHIKNILKETGAPLAGEMSGHIFFNDIWFGFDDGPYSAFRLIKILMKKRKTLDQIYQNLPSSFSTPEINIDVLEDEKFKIVNNFIKFARFDKGEKITIDGLRVNFEDGWGLLRASNTTPKLVLRFEAKSQKRLIEIQHLFLSQLKLIDESIEIKIS